MSVNALSQVNRTASASPIGGARQVVQESPLSVFSSKVSESIDVIKTTPEKTAYKEEVTPLDVAGPEFKQTVAKQDFKLAQEVYTKGVLNIADKEIVTYDKNKDNAINQQEQVSQDLKAYQNKYGEIDNKTVKQFELTSQRANIFMDLNQDKKVDRFEFAAFLYATDANNSKNIANGEISRDEFTKASSHFEKPLDDAAGTFRGNVISAFKGLFGKDPRPEAQ